MRCVALMMLIAAPSARAVTIRTAADPIACNIAADYRVGATEMGNDYGWCVDYGGGSTAPLLRDERRTPGGADFRVTFTPRGGQPSIALNPHSVQAPATYPNGQRLRFPVARGVTADEDMLVLSSSVTAQRVTLRNATGRVVSFTATASEDADGISGYARAYRRTKAGIEVTRTGIKDARVRLTMDGATWSGAAEFTGSAKFVSPSSPDFPRGLPVAPRSVSPSASFTYSGDSTFAPLDSSSLKTDARWTAWSSRNARDWYEVRTAQPMKVSAVTLHLFIDKQGCWAPKMITVQWWNGTAYADLASVSPDPDMADGPITLTFHRTETTRLRAVFDWQGGGRYGGLRAFRTDPPLPEAPSHSIIAVRRTITVPAHGTARFLATLTTAPPGRTVAPVTETEFERALRRTEQVNATTARLFIGDPVIDPLIREQANLVEQTIFGPQGRFHSPSFAFARGGMRHPGWSEDHQHAHEGLAYIPLAISDPSGLRGILRSFFSQQTADGRVPYGTSMAGPLGDIATFPSLSLLTWRLYSATHDRTVLTEFVPCLRRFNAWWYANRFDADPGLFWWGSYESTRDGSNPEDLKGPRLGLPGGHGDMVNPDLTALIYADNRLIARMLETLGDRPAAVTYTAKAAALKHNLEFLWDDNAANYQYRARKSVQADQRWVRSVDVGSLLPLWAGMVDGPRARRIIKTHLLNPKEMWRKNGIPSLSAADPDYTAIPWSSNWNGQLWIQWNTLFVDALLHYGFPTEANQLARKAAKMQSAMLVQRHHFFEDYSADTLEHRNAIYDYTWGGGNIQSFLDIKSAKRNGGRFSIYDQ